MDMSKITEEVRKDLSLLQVHVSTLMTGVIMDRKGWARECILLLDEPQFDTLVDMHEEMGRLLDEIKSERANQEAGYSPEDGTTKKGKNDA